MIDPETSNRSAALMGAVERNHGLLRMAGSSATRGETSAQAKPLLVCFSHLRWHFVFQRPQHLLNLAASHFDIIFVEEPLLEAVSSPRLSFSRLANGIGVAVPCLPETLAPNQHVHVQRALITSLLAGQSRRTTVFWYYTPMALAFSAGLDRDLTVFDNMDELSAFRGASPELLALEDALLQQADIVFAGGNSLYEAKRGRHPNLHAFPSGIDVDHFIRARAPRQKRRARTGPGTQPRLGFFGVIDERLDTTLVDGIATRRPDWQIDMVGPVVKIDPASLPRRPNINWLGACPYAQLPERLATWDVGIMPFAMNEATRFISPTKTPEFLAAGLPVVSTPIVDVVRSYGKSGLVEIGTDPDGFVARTERLLLRPVRPWLDRVDRHLATRSWTTTWAAMHALMTDLMGPRAVPRRVVSESKSSRSSCRIAKTPGSDASVAEAV